MAFRRPVAGLLLGVALIGAGVTFLRAQTPEPRPPERARLRSEVIRLRAEVEMLRFDFELARDDLRDDLKTRKSLELAGGLLQFGFAVQSAVNQAGEQQPGKVAGKQAEQDRKKAAEEAKKAEAEENERKAELAAFISGRKKELAARLAVLEETRMDLEDVEREYRAGAR